MAKPSAWVPGFEYVTDDEQAVVRINKIQRNGLRIVAEGVIVQHRDARKPFADDVGKSYQWDELGTCLSGSHHMRRAYSEFLIPCAGPLPIAGRRYKTDAGYIATVTSVFQGVGFGTVDVDGVQIRCTWRSRLVTQGRSGRTGLRWWEIDFAKGPLPRKRDKVLEWITSPLTAFKAYQRRRNIRRAMQPAE